MSRRLVAFASLLVAPLILGAGCPSLTPETPAEIPSSPVVTPPMPTTRQFPGTLPSDRIEKKVAHIVTPKGEIIFELFNETAPMTVSNFVALAEDGFYDGLTFHRREEGFVIQGGDPNGNGTGGPGYKFADELNDPYTYERGIVAMANSGPNTNGSQFFIMLADEKRLPKNYTIFGRVLSGLEVVDAIRVGDIMTKVTIDDRR